MIRFHWVSQLVNRSKYLYHNLGDRDNNVEKPNILVVMAGLCAKKCEVKCQEQHIKSPAPPTVQNFL